MADDIPASRTASNTASHTALSKAHDALDEQRVELALFRHNLKQLQEAAAALATNLVRLDRRLDTAATANKGLRTALKR